MSINLWDRTASVVRARFRSSAVAQFGAGLHTDCEDCSLPPSDVPIPMPRRRAAEDLAARTPERL